MESIGEVTVLTRPGAKMPLLRSATGLTFAAWLPPRERDADAAREPAELQAQLHDPASPLCARIESIRQSGLSLVQGLMVPGIDAMAAPVFGARSEIVAAVTLIGTDNSFDPSPDGPLARKLSAFAKDASAKLGAPG
jgi:DNA-binding IclR family transcriptional regulator